jgi:O-antigen ligase
MALILLTEKVPRQALESLFRRTIYILIPFSLLLIKYYRYLGVEYGDWSGGLMWIGVTTQKNSLGGLCITSVFFIIWSIISRWGKRDTLGSKYQTFATIIIFIISLWLLKGPGNAYSATAIAALAFGLVMLFVLFWLKKRQIFLSKGTLSAIIVFIIIFGFTTFFTGGATIGGIVGTLGRDSTLTGRTEVWASLVPVAMNHPILGHGFGSFWTQETKKLYEISGSHSGYLDIFLELGIFGIILITIFFMNSVRKARELQIANFDWSVLWICFLTMMLVENITESTISSLSSYSMAMIVFLTVATYINPRQPQHSIPGDSDQTQILIK